MKCKFSVLIVLLSCISVSSAWACTSVIITGKVTPDGRPLLWKHRDTETDWNHIAFFNQAKYPFVGLVNSNNPTGDIWTGMNEMGFTIMNTASFNLKDDNVKEMDREGALMRQALGICKNLSDFEHFLDTLTRPMGVEANFGVIDASGGAAYYETGNRGYVKMDVNDEKLAPEGYMIYTNFSFHGRKDKGLGYIRYETAKKLFSQFKKEDFTPQHILATCSRSFYNSILKCDLVDEENSPNRLTDGWCVEQDFIPRKESSAAIVIQGVKPGMNPELTTMWTVLGYPPASVALPVWVKMGQELPELLAASSSTGRAPLCEKAVELENRIFPIKRGNGAKYIHWQLLYNDENKGIMQQLKPVEEAVFELFTSKQKNWEQTGLNTDEIRQLYREADLLVKKAYQENFGL